jgi:predicted deacylase
VTIADSDLDAVGNQAAEYKLTYTVLDPTAGAATSSTIAASVNAAKRIGSFTLSAAAGKLVTITVERVSDGKVWTYYRKANASGVATFLIRKFGRFDVFASYGDDVTDTVRMRRR